MLKRTSKISKLGPIKGLILPYTKYFYIILIAIIISSSSILMISRLVRYLVDNGFFRDDMEMINKSCLLMIILVIALTIGSIIRLHCINHVGEWLIGDLRRALHRTVLRMPSREHDVVRPGSLIAILMHDTEAMYNIIVGSLSSAVRNAMLASGSIIIMFATSVKLSLFTAVVLPLIIAPIMILGARSKKSAKTSGDLSSQIFSEAESTISNLHLIQSYAREPLAEEKFAAVIEKRIIAAKQHSLLRSCLVAVVLMLSFFAVIVLIWLSGREIAADRLSGGEVSSFLLLLVLCGASMGSVADSAQDVGRLFGLCEKLDTFLKKHSQSTPEFRTSAPVALDKFNKITAEAAGSEIVIKNLTFTYPSKFQPAIIDNSFVIEKNKITALIGESGAGKSTIIKLLLRLYEYNQGCIFYNGVEIKDIPTNILRNNITYVSQDSYIFADTIYANIAYGKPEASMDEIMKAAEIAAATDFIESLPDGIMTFIGEKGVQLSGGQKQRVCIARAILRDSRLLLLDEATSSLDSYNEDRVHAGISALLSNRTTLVVAHRLSTILKADRILVLRHGHLVQSGRHDELVADRDGEYFRLLNSGKLFAGEE